jgi:hypothetical protein
VTVSDDDEFEWPLTLQQSLEFHQHSKPTKGQKVTPAAAVAVTRALRPGL